MWQDFLVEINFLVAILHGDSMLKNLILLCVVSVYTHNVNAITTFDVPCGG
jgi:hypothetical protein